MKTFEFLDAKIHDLKVFQRRLIKEMSLLIIIKDSA